jgi:tetratricopeptide (TPR) repeat protein
LSTSLLEMAEAKDFEGVLATYRDRPAEEVMVVADRLREDDIYTVAIALYGWLLNRDETAAAHFGTGQCHGKVYDYATAAEHLGRAFELDPERTEGASYYAYILERLGRLDEAAPWYDRAIAGADADDLWALSHRAWFLEKWGRPEEAVAAFRDVLTRNPAYTWASKRFSLLLRSLGRREEAEEVIAGPVASNPANRFARLNLLEYRLLDEDGPGYEEIRATLTPGPPWHEVVVELFDLYRDVLLPGGTDPARLAAWEASAEALTDSVHRDFDDLTALLAARSGDVDEWKRLIQLLLK